MRYVLVFALAVLKVSKFQNEFMKSSFLPKHEPNIVMIYIMGEMMTS